MYVDYYDSPIGTIQLTATDSGLRSLLFCNRDQKVQSNDTLKNVIKQLDGYFNSKRAEFDLPFDLIGTDFQKRVWQELTKIPYGRTCSYLDIANSLNNKKAVRAVGAANGKNPISIIIPCHRVIGSDGTLTGYAGGLDRKRWLLEHEGIDI